MSLIEVKDLVYSYDNETNAVDGISFNVEEGSYTTIIGHNGSGKSTLAKLIAGLLESKQGSITIDGIELSEKTIKDIRNKMAIVFQNPDNQFIGSTVRDDIAFGLENHLVETEKMEAIIEEYSKKTGLEEFLDKEPSNLSGGQKQRVAIAGALAMNPNIIIFDEATSMLDPKGKRDIKKLMYELHKENNITIISITHDIEEVLQGDNCIVLSKGKIFMQGKPDEIFSKTNELRKIGLDIPFSSLVKEEFKNVGFNIKSNDLEGMVEELWQFRSKN